MLASDGFLDISGARLESRSFGPSAAAAPTLVLLHEGLGSVGLWGAFPQKLAAATGLGVFAWSRLGYGRSSPVTLPRPVTYLADEAVEALPPVLDAIGLQRGILVGHSDGASIAAIHAARIGDPRVAGLVLIAPHVFTEDSGIAAIGAARDAYRTGDLRARLARHHDDVDGAFWGWNGAWLDPAFLAFDVTDELAAIGVPVLVVQGEDDPYGTLRQVEVLQQRCGGPVETMVLPQVGHAPHRDAPEVVVARIAAFAARVFNPRTSS